MKYEQISELLFGISERFDWDKIMQGDNIIGLKQGKQSISLEPSGQFELSGAPFETLHQTRAEVNSHLFQHVKAVAEEMGIGFLGIGFQPKWGLKDIPVMLKIGRPEDWEKTPDPKKCFVHFFGMNEIGNAGGKGTVNFDVGLDKNKECTLILTEGDSAKALAMAGLSIVGRNYYGVFFLLRGCSCESTRWKWVSRKQESFL